MWNLEPINQPIEQLLFQKISSETEKDNTKLHRLCLSTSIVICNQEFLGQRWKMCRNMYLIWRWDVALTDHIQKQK